jgi:spermidine synthase
MKRWLSYLGPIRLKMVDSPFHQDLHIALDSGKKVLHAGNVNYSYGPLQHILEEGLRQILPSASPQSILILGLGAGSIVQSLREKFLVSAPITAVEIDPQMVEIAQTEFNLGRFENVSIHIDSAENFLSKHPSQFDLIIVDLFFNQHIPAACLEIPFFEELNHHLRPHGNILFNTFRDTFSSDNKKSLTSFFENKNCQITILEKVGITNDLFLISA